MFILDVQYDYEIKNNVHYIRCVVFQKYERFQSVACVFVIRPLHNRPCLLSPVKFMFLMHREEEKNSFESSWSS